ncbi:MAG: MFS transporter [Gemmatimonadota bacterium]
MGRGEPLGREFGWLWAAYGVSTAGTMLAFDAFPIVAIRVLHATAAQVSLLAAAALAAGALIAVPLGPWVETRRKRPVMIAMDLLRFAAMLTVPAAYALGALTLAQLVAVSVVASAANVVFTAASGAYLKALVPAGNLLRASARFESTTWTATAAGPPLGGAAIGIFGPVTTVVANAVSFLLSALGIGAIGAGEPRPGSRDGVRADDVPAAGAAAGGGVLAGWRHIFSHPQLRLLYFYNSLVGGLILATAPLLAVLMLGDLGFAPWQYGLAFGLPCAGGLAGSRAARRLAARYGQRRVMLASGTLSACWPVTLAFIQRGPGGLLLVIVAQSGLVTSLGVFNPIFAAYRLEQTGAALVTRTLSAWSVTKNITIAALTLAWGLLAAVTGPRAAIAAAGLLLLGTPLLLPFRRRAHREERAPATPDAPVRPGAACP